VCSYQQELKEKGKMMKATITTAMAAVLLLAVNAAAQPGGMPGRPIGGPGMHEPGPAGDGGDFFQRMLPIIRMLDLSDDQRESIGDIMHEAQASIESIRETTEVRSHREEFLELFSSSTLSASEVEALLNEMKDVNEIVASALVDIHDVLTDEQLAALSEFTPGSMGMGMSHGGGRGGMGHPGSTMGVHPH
jgi:Spy/CpxP family protein refolding chaperone